MRRQRLTACLMRKKYYRHYLRKHVESNALKGVGRIQRYYRSTKLAGLGGLQTMKAVHTLRELRPTNSRFCSLDASLRCNPPLTCAALPGAAHIKGSQIESCGPWP